MAEILQTITYLVFSKNTKNNWIGKTIKRSQLRYFYLNEILQDHEWIFSYLSLILCTIYLDVCNATKQSLSSLNEKS